LIVSEKKSNHFSIYPFLKLHQSQGKSTFITLFGSNNISTLNEKSMLNVYKIPNEYISENYPITVGFFI
jgi:hypothetical protein